MVVQNTLAEVIVNGVARPLRVGTTILQLVAELGVGGKRIAVERNGDIVPRSAYARTVVHAGDRLEIVVAVGGG